MVFKAVHRQTNKQVAMKCINNVFDNVGVARRYLRELHTMVQMRQMPNLVTLYDVLLVPSSTGQDFASLYLVMSSMSFDLAYLLASDKVKLDQDSVKYIIYQLLVGIGNLHAAGVIHRDIKPANILLNSECSLKLCDFGLARDLSQIQNPYEAFKTFKNQHPQSEDSWVAF
jgi:serine/threonine protein kinase